MNKKIDWFNPTFREFVNKYEDKSMLGMAWSLYWRLSLVILGVYVVLIFVGYVFSL